MRPAALALAVVFALFLSGCGGGERQDANAPSGSWKVTVLDWKFAVHQSLGTPQPFTIQVRNDDTRTIPNLIITIEGLKTLVYQPGAASAVRPIWLTQDVDYANSTPYNSTLGQSFNMGPVEPGDTVTYNVMLTPLRRGEHEVSYQLHPDLFGDGTVVNASDGMNASETRTVAIDPTPVFDEKLFED
ncbi:MAG: hypothetical protein QM648_02705 [Solirubrobacterales bacterium]